MNIQLALCIFIFFCVCGPDLLRGTYSLDWCGGGGRGPQHSRINGYLADSNKKDRKPGNVQIFRISGLPTADVCSNNLRNEL
jgi:hypothetical protein